MFRSTICSLIILLALAAAPAAAGDDYSLPALVTESYTLDNGLQVILHVDHSAPIAAVNVWYHVGSADEAPGLTGLAHLCEHLMFQGSVHHDTDYFQPLQAVGGRVNGSTNTDRTNYWEDVPTDYLQRALWLEADRMAGLVPALTEARLDRQRDIVRNEVAERSNRPYAGADEQLLRLLFPVGHPYRHPVAGSMTDLDGATLADVTAFLTRHYTPDNASLCVAGDFTPEEVKGWIAEYFGPVAPGRQRDRQVAWVPVLTSERRAVAYDDVELPRLYLAWHTPGYYEPGDAEFDLLGLILAEGRLSRLHKRLVDELKLAQNVRAVQRSRELSGVFEVRVTAAPGRTLAEVEIAVDAELTRLLVDGASDEEIAWAKAAFETDFVRGLQKLGGFGGRADRLNRYHFFADQADYLDRDLARYQAADRKSVQRWAARYLAFASRAVLHVLPRVELSAAGTVVPDLLPGSTGTVSFKAPMVQTATLANGLQILLVRQPQLPLVEFRLVVRAGWARDPQGKAGTAALTAGVLEEGTQKMNGAVRGGELGATLTTDCGPDGSEVRLSVLTSRSEAGLDLLSTVVRKPTFSTSALGQVRGRFQGRRQQAETEPRQQALTVLQVRCFGADHPYAQPLSGTPATLTGIGQSDLKAFHDTYYRPNNAALLVVGDMDLPTAVNLAEEAFDGWRSADIPPANIPPSPPVTGSRLLVIDRPGAAQSYILGGRSGLARSDPDHDAMTLVEAAFGTQLSSRLNRNLRRDKGYTYGAYSELHSLRAGGLITLRAFVAADVTAAALRELQGELAAVSGARPLTSEELTTSRRSLIQGFPQTFRTLAAVADQLVGLWLNNLPADSWQTLEDRLYALDDNTVAAVGARHLAPGQFVWVVVGDAAQVVPQLTDLGLGQPEILENH